MKAVYVKHAWLVIVLSLVFGVALAAVHAGLKDRIEANKLDDIRRQIPALVPGTQSIEEAQVDGQIVYRALAGGRQIGWAVRASGQGFGDVIELLIGLDAKVTKITGLYVLDQKETPGLGERIRSDEQWRRQFRDQAADKPLTVTKAPQAGPGEIKAITGATVSSQSVADIVNQTVAAMRGKLAAAAKD